MIVAGLAGLEPSFHEVIAAGGVGFERLSAPIDGHCGTPLLSPDGTQLAFERRDEVHRTRQVLLLRLDARQEQPVVLTAGSSSSLLSHFQQRPLPVLRDFAWTPAGPFKVQHPYVLTASREARNATLYLAGLGRLTDNDATEGQPAWSPDGRQLVYVSSVTGEGDLYLLELGQAGGRPRRLTRTEHEAELFPTWSPRGTRLCFVRHGPRGDNLYVMEPSGRTPIERALTGWSSTQSRPSWSPDGSRIAFYSNRRDPERVDVYVLEVGSQPVPRLVMQNVLPSERHGPAWTPDGRSLVVVEDSRPQLDPLVLVSVETGVSRLIPTGTVNNQDPEVGLRAGRPWLFFSAQGREGDGGDRMWRRIYGGPLSVFRAENK